jgi:hypothetical protein
MHDKPAQRAFMAVVGPTLDPRRRLGSSALVTLRGPSVLTSNWCRMRSKSRSSSVSSCDCRRGEGGGVRWRGGCSLSSRESSDGQVEDDYITEAPCPMGVWSEEKGWAGLWGRVRWGDSQYEF